MLLGKLLEHSQSKSELCLKKQSLKFWKRTGKIFVRNVFVEDPHRGHIRPGQTARPWVRSDAQNLFFFRFFGRAYFAFLKRKKH